MLESLGREEVLAVPCGFWEARSVITLGLNASLVRLSPAVQRRVRQGTHEEARGQGTIDTALLVCKLGEEALPAAIPRRPPYRSRGSRKTRRRVCRWDVAKSAM